MRKKNVFSRKILSKSDRVFKSFENKTEKLKEHFYQFDRGNLLSICFVENLSSLESNLKYGREYFIKILFYRKNRDTFLCENCRSKKNMCTNDYTSGIFLLEKFHSHRQFDYFCAASLFNRLFCFFI
jgi:hypothetical protein